MASDRLLLVMPFLCLAASNRILKGISSFCETHLTLPIVLYAVCEWKAPLEIVDVQPVKFRSNRQSNVMKDDYQLWVLRSHKSSDRVKSIWHYIVNHKFSEFHFDRAETYDILEYQVKILTFCKMYLVWLIDVIVAVRERRIIVDLLINRNLLHH